MKKLFLTTPIGTKGDIVEIQNEDYHHLIRTLRLKIGDSILIGNEAGAEFIGEIKHIDKQKAQIELKDYYLRKDNDLPNITLFFAVLKGDKNELLMQKCTEIGVNNFIPVFSKNTIIKPTNIEKKIERWKKIVKEASQQSGRQNIPKIFNAILLEEIEKYVISSNKIFGAINGKYSLKNYIERGEIESIDVLIGPEGDFSSKEIAKLNAFNWVGVNLTDTVLKSETAAIFIASSLMFYYNN